MTRRENKGCRLYWVGQSSIYSPRVWPYRPIRTQLHAICRINKPSYFMYITGEEPPGLVPCPYVSKYAVTPCVTAISPPPFALIRQPVPPASRCLPRRHPSIPRYLPCPPSPVLYAARPPPPPEYTHPLSKAG